MILTEKDKRIGLLCSRKTIFTSENLVNFRTWTSVDLDPGSDPGRSIDDTLEPEQMKEGRSQCSRDFTPIRWLSVSTVVFIYSIMYTFNQSEHK